MEPNYSAKAIVHRREAHLRTVISWHTVSKNTMRVRDLHSLFVTTPGKPFTMAVRKSSETSQSDHLKALSLAFIEKLGTRRAVDCHSVHGSSTILEEKADQIFAEVFTIPYENDEEWQFQVDDHRGCLKLVEPGLSTVNTGNPTGLGGERSATTVSGAPRRTRDEVCR